MLERTRAVRQERIQRDRLVHAVVAVAAQPWAMMVKMARFGTITAMVVRAVTQQSSRKSQQHWAWVAPAAQAAVAAVAAVVVIGMAAAVLEAQVLMAETVHRVASLFTTAHTAQALPYGLSPAMARASTRNSQERWLHNA